MRVSVDYIIHSCWFFQFCSVLIKIILYMHKLHEILGLHLSDLDVQTGFIKNFSIFFLVRYCQSKSIWKLFSVKVPLRSSRYNPDGVQDTSLYETLIIFMNLGYKFICEEPWVFYLLLALFQNLLKIIRMENLNCSCSDVRSVIDQASDGSVDVPILN